MCTVARVAWPRASPYCPIRLSAGIVCRMRVAFIKRVEGTHTYRPLSYGNRRGRDFNRSQEPRSSECRFSLSLSFSGGISQLPSSSDKIPRFLWPGRGSWKSSIRSAAGDTLGRVGGRAPSTLLYYFASAESDRRCARVN